MSTARTKPSKPTIIKRAEWGAQSGGGLAYTGDLSKSYYRGTLHHDASPASRGMTAQQARQVMRNHQDLHMRSLGWSDIGYHYIIDPAGRIYEGRPISVQGSHTYMENSGNVGICLMGELHLHPQTPEQLESLKLLWAWLCWELDMDSSALKGHMDYMPTQCPGKAQLEIPGVRQSAKDALTGSPVAPEQPKAPSLVVNGRNAGEVILVDGVSYAPIRTIAEAAGMSVGWDAATKTVSLSRE